ncbi:MAG TPA: TetR/AcrR family transcriptional regulator [Candidatus Dormibacteraeota bacterium]|nr:TetR/AcrR family transcriptional regulator [Candidatus Dormibacteraeota bacterium]
MAGRKSAEDGPRERLLSVARRLFYNEGVHVVGIDRILAEAGVARASLYQHYGSKDGLVRAYLEDHFDTRKAYTAAVVSRYRTPRRQLIGLFEDIDAVLAIPTFRGCGFINASAEAGSDECVGPLTERYRSWLRGLFTDLSRQAKARDAAALGRQLALLYDGAAVAARLDSDRSKAAAAARTAALELINAALKARS